MGLRRAAVAIGLGLALAATPARADDNADRIRTAAKEFDEGRRLYLENQFEQALQILRIGITGICDSARAKKSGSDKPPIRMAP